MIAIEPSTASVPGWRVAATALLILVGASMTSAQDATEPSLKAAFIYNFARFTQWPDDMLPVAGSFNACVLDDGPVGDALEHAVKGRLLSDHQVNVLRMRPRDSLRACHLLFVSGLSEAQVITAIASIQGAPVLTISDIDDFVRMGGIAHIFAENGKMRFEINLELARHSHLQLSSKLLSLATSVHDIPHRDVDHDR